MQSLLDPVIFRQSEQRSVAIITKLNSDRVSDGTHPLLHHLWLVLPVPLVQLRGRLPVHHDYALQSILDEVSRDWP